MCGIVAVISSDQIDPYWIENMTEALAHRGPDAKGIYMAPNGRLALGHTRLSIIDLDNRASQPFFSANGRYVVAFNGEIYNYREIANELRSTSGICLKTTSDTEVIAEAFSVWGSDCVNRFEGMFAIVIADLLNGEFHIFRDRLGKKPIYYYQDRYVVAVASEIKSLLKLPMVVDRKINSRAISVFLHLGYIPEPDTIYSQIHKFPAGNVGHINSSMQFTIAPFWSVTEVVTKGKIECTDQEAVNRLDRILNDSVSKRLISDVPLGAFLSGGTDSSLITAIAQKKVNGALRTFSIGFSESKFDESKFANQVAAQLKTNHTSYILSQREAIGILETYLDHFDEPFADTSAIPTMLVSRLAKSNVSVALTGDGGDELFQGYGAYRWAKRLERISYSSVKSALEKLLYASGNSRLRRVSKLFENVPPQQIRSHIFSQEQYFFSQSEIKSKLLVDKGSYFPFAYNDFKSFAYNASECQALFDIQYYLKDDLLVKVDRASMYYGLECRSPLLDQSVVEFAISLPYSLKVRQGHQKWILKSLLRHYLPDELVDRPKWGFSIPLANWMKGELHYLADDFLSKESLEKTGVFNQGYVRQLCASFHSGDHYLFNRLWTLIVLQRWLLKERKSF